MCFQSAARTTGWDVADDVSLQFMLTLNANQGTGNWAVLLISFTDRVIEFAHDGSVTIAD